MQQVKAIDGRRGRRSAGRHVLTRLRAGFVALSLAGVGAACLAADSVGGLDSAFRPQGSTDVPSDGTAERVETNLSGLRVVVASASRSVASIDGKIVHVGDMLNGKRVTRIDQHGVVLTGQGGAIERLTVTPSMVKRERPAKATSDSQGAAQ